jgi:hypothetical protein
MNCVAIINQGHMAMPGLPLPGLVLRHPNMTLLASWKARSIQKRWACIFVSFVVLV